MKKCKKSLIILIVLSASFALLLAGCESNTVASLIVSDRQYNESDLKNAKQPEQLRTGKDIYASVYFIESPMGMEYTAKWFINGIEVKTDTKKLPTDRKGMIIFTLEGDKVIAGRLKFQINYGNDILDSKELVIAEE